MSCIFSCFRVKGASSSVLKNSSPEETTVNRNRSPLSSFFIPEENVRVASKGNRLVQQDLDFEELKNQAKFLKACGTMPKTPTEIRKAAKQKNDISSQKGAIERPKFKSWLTYTSPENLDLESQLDQLPNFNKDSEEWLDGAFSHEHTPSSCITIEDNTERISPNSSEVYAEVLTVLDHNTSESSVSSNTTLPNIPCKNQSVRFDSQLDMHSASSEIPTPQTLKVFRPAGNLSNNIKLSPYPTPLKLTDEMQTPGTVFVANVDDIGQGNFPRTRIQYVSHSVEGSEKNMYPLLETESPNLHRVKNPGDRPIIGLVATHWNENEERSRVSPKWWDGNGIPNSTNKYREDQKVSWIATSFEERLEKALSEETLISQRKQSSGTPPVKSVET